MNILRTCICVQVQKLGRVETPYTNKRALVAHMPLFLTMAFNCDGSAKANSPYPHLKARDQLPPKIPNSNFP